ncbi:unnamed protein product [Cunninghamella echinulata]
MSGYQNYYTDGQGNKSTVNSSAYGDTNQANYYNNYYGGYEGYDASQYYNPNGYYGGGEEYYQYNDGSGYAPDGTANSVARYSHSFATSAEDGSTAATGSTASAANGAAATSGSLANNNKKTMDGMTSAQRKKLAYYQYFGEEIPEHTTSGYTREDDQGLVKPTGLASATAPIPTIPTPLPPSMTTPTIAAAPTVGNQGGGGGKMAHKKKNHEKGNHKKSITMRYAAGETWEDQSLADWDDSDYRLFAGDLGNEVTDETLFKAFAKYPTCQKARVVRDKRSGKTRGYGFISFGDANDFVKAWREMNGKYVGNRPIKLRKSTWQDRNIESKMKKEKEKSGASKRR